MKKRTIAPIPLPLAEDQQQIMDKIFPSALPSPNLYRIVLKNRPLFEELVTNEFLGPTGIFDRRRLAPALREKIILRTCVASNNSYEFALHEETISQKMGLTKAQLSDIKNTVLHPDHWDDADLALFGLIDNLVAHKTVPDDIFDAIQTQFNEEQIIEIILIIGFYTGIAMLVAFCKPELDNYKNLLK